jgi:regulator of protease activity HflC (stomatin/prohibitin superfamily)
VIETAPARPTAKKPVSSKEVAEPAVANVTGESTAKAAPTPTSEELEEAKARIREEGAAQLAAKAAKAADAGPKPCLADFELLKVLGQGSFGKVLLAEHRKLHHVVAIKVRGEAQLAPVVSLIRGRHTRNM